MKLSIVIPALNEASRIETTLHAVRRQAGAHEVIVVDGGSVDETAALAAPLARVIQAPRGRARQMNAGAAVAGGDTLLFLHADSSLPEDGIAAVHAALENPGVEAGAFRLRFDRTSPLLNFYSLCTRLTSPLICFGDRALFVRRSVFDAMGGFPEIPVFEDLEFVRRLHRRGGFAFLPGYVTTAARRFDAHGHLRQQLLNSYLWTRYLLGTPPEQLADFYRYAVKR